VKRLHIIGGKNHGKTMLVVELVQEFARRGIPVGTIKHTHHHHEVDVPGKDSHRHRLAGAAAASGREIGSIRSARALGHERPSGSRP
jgi:molybdopterin-guanine dinucleotide biosynthesis protein MobB